MRERERSAVQRRQRRGGARRSCMAGTPWEAVRCSRVEALMRRRTKHVRLRQSRRPFEAVAWREKNCSLQQTLIIGALRVSLRSQLTEGN